MPLKLTMVAPNATGRHSTKGGWDYSPLRVLAAESLKRLGYTVLQAGNGLEALAVADQHSGKIDVVVTDVVMPRMGGPELVEKLRQNTGTPAGVGLGMNPPQYLKAGDVVELGIDGLGESRQKVVP
jgi:CheY-like chemotaxis protein